MIDILGGTFDPIHNGHLHIAAEACSRLGLQQVRLMPCKLPVHRARPQVGADERCAMIEMALGSDSRFQLSRIEIERDGPSYTVDSLLQIKQTTSATLVLLLGSDAFNGFTDWHQPQRILELAHIVVCLRPGVTLDDGLYRERRVEQAGALDRGDAGCILALEVDAPNISSSAVRAALSRGEVDRECLPAPVADYIERKHLYRRTGD